MPDTIHQYEPLWGSWQVDVLLGAGSYGKVYRVRREEFGQVQYAAVKIISMPQSETELRQLMDGEGYDEASARSHYNALVMDILQEIRLMSEFRGNSNIVSFEDYKVIERQDVIGWDILIRMELLNTLTEWLREHNMTQREVLTMAIHICKALELCAQKNTIHRDIKPENIFVSSFGEYKLGDFGIARQIESTMSGLSKKGTYTYMAPEVYRGDEYNATVDLYSLGIVMYRLLNQNRPPFVPSYPQVVAPREREEAFARRIKGDPIPAIPGIDASLNALVLKACAFDRKKRFRNATEMRVALEALLNGKEMQAGLDRQVITQQGEATEAVEGSTSHKRSTSSQGKKKGPGRSYVPMIIFLSALMLGIVVTGVLWVGKIWPFDKPAPVAVDGLMAAQGQQLSSTLEPQASSAVLDPQAATSAALETQAATSTALEPTAALSTQSEGTAVAEPTQAPAIAQERAQTSDATPAPTEAPAPTPTSEQPKQLAGVANLISKQVPMSTVEATPTVETTPTIEAMPTAEPTQLQTADLTPTPQPTPTPEPTPTPTPTPAPTPEPTPTQAPSRYEGQRMQPLTIREAYSPSEYPGAKRSWNWGPINVLDSNEDTCWQYNKEYADDGYKTYIVLYLSDASKVRTLSVKNGFWKVSAGIDQYKRNGRVKDAIISFQYEGSDEFTDAFAYTFADQKKIADIDLGDRENVVAVRIAIESVYMGQKWDEIAITYAEIVGYPAKY